MKYIVRETYKHGNAIHVEEDCYNYAPDAYRGWASCAESWYGKYPHAEVVEWKTDSLFIKSGDMSAHIEFVIVEECNLPNKRRRADITDKEPIFISSDDFEELAEWLEFNC